MVGFPRVQKTGDITNDYFHSRSLMTWCKHTWPKLGRAYHVFLNFQNMSDDGAIFTLHLDHHYQRLGVCPRHVSSLRRFFIDY